MGRGRGPCTKVGGYENPAIAAWTLASALLAVSALTLLLLGEAVQLKDTISVGLLPEQYGDVRFVSRSTFIILGCIHVLLFILSCAVTILGYFLCSKLLCFACPLVIINELVCLVTSSFCGYMLDCLNTYRNARLEAVRLGLPSPTPDFSLLFVDSHASFILLVAVCCLCALAPLCRAGTIDAKGTMVDIMIHLPVISGCMAMSGVMLFPSRIPLYVVLGAAWLIASLVAGVLVALQKCGGITSRITTLILAVFYLVVLVLALISIIASGVHFVAGRQLSIDVIRTPEGYRETFIAKMSQQDFDYFKNYVVLNEGGFYLAYVVISGMVLIYSFMGSAFSLRACLGGGSALTRDTDDSNSGD